MREFEITLAGEDLRHGLRNSFRQARNSRGLVDCLNLKVLEDGLASYEPLVMPISSGALQIQGIYMAWPNPQILRGWKNTFLVHDRRIFLVDESDWSLFELEIYDVDNVSQILTPNKGRAWQLADMGDSWMLTNGVSSVFYHNQAGMFGNEQKVFGQNYAEIETAVYHRGRMITGGLGNENFWNSTWTAFFADWGARLGTGVSTDISLDRNFVMWSSIGYDLFWLFYPIVARDSLLSGAQYSATKPFILEQLARNDMGWAPMPYRGKVFHIKPLGDYLVVYGQYGISVMRPVASPEPTYQQIPLNVSFGINNKGAVGGDDSQHVFMDTEGDLWRITLDERGTVQKPQLLGYKEYFVGDLDLTWIISYDPRDSEFYICAGQEESFVLTRWGLTKVKQIVTNAFHAGRTSYTLGSEIIRDSNSKVEVLVVFDEQDFQTSGLITTQWVKVGANKTFDYSVAFDYRYTDADAWVRTEFAPLNNHGVAYLTVTAKQIRLVLRANAIDDLSNVEPPDWLTVTMKTTDKRFTRGVNVSQTLT